MKLKSKLSGLFLGVLLAAPFATAQVTLHNFSAFESPNTFFLGTWEPTGDLNGTNSPLSTFSQGSGFYNFNGGTNANTSGAAYFFDIPLNITGLSLLEVSAHLLLGNTAPNFTVSLFDSQGKDAFATFAAGSFTGVGFSTVQTALTVSSGFDRTDVSSFLISGNVAFGTALLDVTFDNLAVVASRPITAVPEPSTYGLAMLLILGGAVAISRRRRRMVT